MGSSQKRTMLRFISIESRTSSRVRKSGIQVPLTRNSKFSSCNLESTAWNPEFKSVYDYLLYKRRRTGDVVGKAAKNKTKSNKKNDQFLPPSPV